MPIFANYPPPWVRNSRKYITFVNHKRFYSLESLPSFIASNYYVSTPKIFPYEHNKKNMTPHSELSIATLCLLPVISYSYVGKQNLNLCKFQHILLKRICCPPRVIVYSYIPNDENEPHFALKILKPFE